MYCKDIKSSESGAEYYCGQELVAVPLFTSFEYICPACEPHKIPNSLKNKINELMRKKLGFNETPKNPLPPLENVSNIDIAVKDIS